MGHPLISIIVPIYMIDRYVGICIESILNQTYGDIEVILVDDGSRDRCPDICDLYARKDSRIHVIHKPNGGLVSARKAGLQHSNGEFVSYVDGDDWISHDFIMDLFAAAKQSDADMVCAGQTRVLFSKSAQFTNVLPSGVYEGEKLQALWSQMLSCGSFYRPGVSTYLWNKLFRRDMLLEQQLAVDERITIGEDGAVTYPALMRCKRVVLIDSTAYHYRQREDSMLKSSAAFVEEAQRLKYLYDYMMRWAEKTAPEFGLKRQIVDYLLSICIMRSGGRLPQDTFSTFDKRYYGKKVAIYSAGTFGQQLVNRFRETKHCEVSAWVDDDYWEYRRCCMNVDSVESVVDCECDYILIATVDGQVATRAKERLQQLGVEQEKILTVSVPEDRAALTEKFLDIDALRELEQKKRTEIFSHA